jgi:Tol biopolymer transport system component/DNA-binding winged helix-turn-helix (wHTH) protein
MNQEVLAFGDFRVDFRRMSVWRGAEVLALEPKTFDVLRYLVEHRDRLVTKEELLDAVWKDTFVTPNVLTRAVAQLRKALGDDAFEARYIVTVSKRGYRFIAAVTPVVPAPDAVSVHSSSESPATLRRRVLVGAGLAAIAALLSLAVWNRDGRGDSEARQVRNHGSAPQRLTTDDRSYFLPAISADGRMMAYSSGETGALEIYTAALAPNSRQVAITSDGGQNQDAAWSPDGRWIAYSSRRKGGVWVVPSDGGTSRQVAAFGSQPVWAADGQRVYLTSTTGGMAAQANLWSVQRDGGDLKPFTSLGKPKGGHFQPAVSPDGKLVAFSVAEGRIGHEMWLVPVAGGEPVRVGKKTPYGDLQFAPDSRSLYWTDRSSEGNDCLMRVALSADGSPVGEPETVVTFTGYLIGRFSIARDGTALVGLFRGTANLWAVDFSSHSTEPAIALMTDEVRNSQPRHSRDGRLAFHQFGAGQLNSTWLADEDGRNRQSLTTGLPVGVWTPQWSADNQRLFVTTADRQSSSLAFGWLDVSTRALSRLPLSAAGVYSARLSPDDKEIAFHVIQDDGVLNVWRQSLDGGVRRQVTFDKEAASYPVWTHDGKSLIVEIKRGESTQIAVVSKDGGPMETLVEEKGQNWPFSLSPDDQHVAFAGEREGVWNIYIVSRRTKALRQLTRFTTGEGFVRYPSWSFTRSRIVFERAEEKGSVWTLNLR